jgi:hypothetical protein
MAKLPLSARVRRKGDWLPERCLSRKGCLAVRHGRASRCFSPRNSPEYASFRVKGLPVVSHPNRGGLAAAMRHHCLEVPHLRLQDPVEVPAVRSRSLKVRELAIKKEQSAGQTQAGKRRLADRMPHYRHGDVHGRPAPCHASRPACQRPCCRPTASWRHVWRAREDGRVAHTRRTFRDTNSSRARRCESIGSCRPGNRSSSAGRSPPHRPSAGISLRR